jgi:hypothetical protein
MSARESWTKRRAQREEASPRTLAPTTPMNAVHRCDRCGAQAYVQVLLHNSRDLLFCAHHYRQHAPALAKIAVEIQDETDRLAWGDRPGSRD